jgi:RNAse (barnase) inhibitor barstar
VKRLSDMLKDPKTSGVYMLEESPSVEHLEKLTSERGLAFFRLEGQEIRDKDQFLKQASLALRFPEYFGNNWDAFADCLTDMSWHETDGFVILYDHFDSLAAHSPRDFEMALDIFKESTEFWHNRGKALFVLLYGKSRHVGTLAGLRL